MAGGYTQRNITVYYDIIWLASNGSIRSEQEELVIRVLQPGDAYLSIDSWSLFEPSDGIWDAGETMRIDIDVSKIGTATVVYAEMGLIETIGPFTFTSNDTYDFIASAFTTWNSSSIYLTSPSDITERSVDVVVGMIYELSTGEVYYDYQILGFDMSPLSAKIELVKAYASLVSGTDDGIFMAGESFSMTSDLENIGNDASGSIFGLFGTEDPDVTFEKDVPLLEWNSLSPGTNELSINSILMEINPGAENKTIIIYLVIGFETWYGEFILDIIPISLTIVQQPDPEPNLNYYQIYDINLVVSSLKPGEAFLVTVEVDVSVGPAFDSIGYLSSDNEDIFIYNDTSYYGDLNPGDPASEGDGFVVYVPANFAGGTVRFYVNVTMYNAVGDLIFDLAYFDVFIEAGDTVIPAFTLDAVSTASEGDSVSITITASDDIGVDDIYFAYYDYTTGDWASSDLETITSTSEPVSTPITTASNIDETPFRILFFISGLLVTTIFLRKNNRSNGR